MFKPGDKLNPYDPASLDLPGDEGVFKRLEAGTSPMTAELADMLKDPANLNALMQMMKADAAERERTGETAMEQMAREKREWAEADAKSAKLKLQGNEAFKEGDYKTAFVIYSACMSLSPQEPLYPLNRVAVALKLNLYTVAAEQASKVMRMAVFNRAKTHFRRGQARCVLVEWKEAEDDFTRALALQPGDPSVLQQIAEMKRLRGLSSEEQAAWISAQPRRALSDVFEPGELERRTEELLGRSLDS
ncbi:hypothetical protein GGX14DRAFT_446120 [Mycena pura]|uniref:TPR-like protein n=1 Tax=Mycena pura TaxID=153505 RepID=A0AAD6VHC9_9AGAR|nr:hypothetical protein GGX14DRAFT_446120 [Mycena pura]